MLCPICSVVQLSEEYVQYSDPSALAQYDYPPRVVFDVTATKDGAEASTLNLKVTGLSEEVGFYVPLPQGELA